MNYIIRRAKMEDASQLQILMKEAYSVYTKLLGGLLLPPMNADYRDEIANYPTWVLEYNNHLVGGLTMYFDEENAHLSNVAINPMYKGQGLGKALINYAENIAREKGYNSLGLVTHVKLLDNIKYYKKMGYEEVERDSDKVFFTKSLLE